MTEQEDGSTPAKKKSRAKGCLLTFVVVLGLGALIDYLDGDPPPPPPPTPEEEHEARMNAHLEAAKDCLSAWDGSALNLNRAVKERLNDPDSFDHESTSIVNLKAFREAVKVAQDKSSPDHRDHQFYTGREIRSLPTLFPGEYNEGSGEYFVVTRFRARNAFGGVVLSSARATLNDDCTVRRLISIQ